MFSNKKKSVLFIDGPGNLINSFQSWRAGEKFSGETAKTYSSQFFDVACRLDLQVYAVAWPGDRDRLEEENFVIEHRTLPFPRAKGVLFHLAQAIWSLELMYIAFKSHAGVALLVDTPHPFFFTPLRFMNIKTVVVLHHSLWPACYPPTKTEDHLILSMNGWFFRRIADNILVLSPECERQVKAVAHFSRRPIAQYRPTFFGKIAEQNKISPGHPFRVLYASRLERRKGALDVLEMATYLNEKRPGDFIWIICGAGSAEEETKRIIENRGLSKVVHLRGQLERDQLINEYRSCDAVIVPTKSTFAEGLAKTAIEGALAGRPVILSETVPARDILNEACLTVTASDIESYIRLIERLADAPAFYRSLCEAAVRVSDTFLETENSFEEVIERTLGNLLHHG